MKQLFTWEPNIWRLLTLILRSPTGASDLQNAKHLQILVVNESTYLYLSYLKHWNWEQHSLSHISSTGLETRMMQSFSECHSENRAHKLLIVIGLKLVVVMRAFPISVLLAQSPAGKQISRRWCASSCFAFFSPAERKKTYQRGHAAEDQHVCGAPSLMRLIIHCWTAAQW